MNLTNEQIEQIIQGAPDWAKYFNATMGAYASQDNRHNLSDLLEILTLRQRVQELELAIEQSLGNMEYAAFNLCETTELKSRDGGKVIESTCPETSLLIAIRDVKEALTPPKE